MLEMIPDSALLMSTPRKSIWRVGIELVIVIKKKKYYQVLARY